MRSVICALALLALPTSAFAGDFDILRGPVSVDWSGFYAGGQIGADFDARILPRWLPLHHNLDARRKF